MLRALVFRKKSPDQKCYDKLPKERFLEGSRENCDMQFGNFQAVEKLEEFSEPVKSMTRLTLKSTLHWGWGQQLTNETHTHAGTHTHTHTHK